MYLFLNETLNLHYCTWREQERKREFSDGINDKLRKMQNFPFIHNDSLVILCHYTCDCDISIQVFSEGV